RRSIPDVSRHGNERYPRERHTNHSKGDHVPFCITIGNKKCSVVSRFSRRKIGYTQDRKSTRLNSSHVKISYAVFCLKKKRPGIRSHSGTRAKSYHSLPIQFPSIICLKASVGIFLRKSLHT